MNERIDQVTIVVGGGSAGWIMELVLTKLLNKADKDRVKVTLIESPRIPNIGVGGGDGDSLFSLAAQGAPRDEAGTGCGAET